MEENVYTAIQSAEDSWWYHGRTFAIQSVLNRHKVPKQTFKTVLDLGSGFGAMHSLLSAYGPVIAYDIDAACLKRCLERGYSSVISSETKLFSPPQPYELVGAFDVIEHIEKDTLFLQNLHRSMAPNGYFIVTVPAHQFLWSEHDRAAHHFRRYSKASFTSLMQTSGFRILSLHYWNSFLFLPAAVLRLLGVGGKEGLNPGKLCNRLLTKALRLEATLQRFLPCGLSLVALMQSQDRKQNPLPVKNGSLL